MRPRPAEWIFAALALFLTSSALFPLLQGGGNSTLVEAQTDTRLTVLSFAVYLVAGALVLRRRQSVAELVGRNRFLFGLVGLAILSTAWSSSPGTTAWRALALALTTILGVYLATAFQGWRLVSLVAWVLLGIVLLSVVFARLRPVYGLDHLRGDAWRGVFTTKNELGRIAVLTAAVWTVRLVTRHGNMLVALGAIAVSFYALDRSGSKTGTLVAALLAGFIVVLPVLRAHHSIAVPAGALLVGVGIFSFHWIAAHSDATLNTFGANSTLTGRAEIWSAVWTMISAHPWLGYGFSAFWRGFDGPSGQVWATIGATPPHAHNGVLDLWLDLGLAGVLLIAGSFLVTAGRAIRALHGAWSAETVFPAAIVGFLLLFNLTESTLLRAHSVFWVLYVATAVQLARAPHRARVSVAQPVAVTS
jgi:exopolysaccharide production protein ExoQ